MHAGGCARNGGEKRNVLIVSVLLPIAIDLALRSNMQKRVDVLRVCQEPILQGVAATPITVMGDAEVKDQAPAARLVPKVGADLHVAAPLACACRYAVLRADRVSGRAEQGAKNRYHPVVRLGCT